MDLAKYIREHSSRFVEEIDAEFATDKSVPL